MAPVSALSVFRSEIFVRRHKEEASMFKKTAKICLAALLAAAMAVGSGLPVRAAGSEDQAAADEVAAMIDAIYTNPQLKLHKVPGI